MAKLVVRSGHNVGSEYPIKDALVHMGRRSQSQVPINDTKASREHAVIRDSDGELHIQDLSRNGTFLNEAPVLKTEPGSPLKFGDKVRIGDTVLELVDEKSEPISIDIPGYTILEKTGSGGMGTVYKAKQLSMDRIVALKVLNERFSNNAEFVDRFIREARAAGKLNHPNVIHVHDISRANGRHYFSMEFIDGPSVRELLKQEKRIEINKALDIILQAAKALEFAHENRIVHRDIKPDNIMLTKEGIVKIADLGIAKTFEDGGAAAGKDGRTVLGTPHYMAPEQAMGKSIDHRVDIYSLGATFYHMITGATPFTGTTAQEILKAHVQASLLPIQDLNKGIPDPVCFIIERMMAKLPEKRYQNMARLIEDIERVQSGQVKGIERIQADDSSIMRAVKGGAPKDRPAEREDETRKRSVTGGQKRTLRERTEAVTGGFVPVEKIASVLFWLALLAAAVAAIIYVPQHLGNNSKNSTEEKDKKPPALPSKPEARALLLEAKDLMGRNEYAKGDDLLFQIRKRFPETLEAEEANNLSAAVAAARRETGRIRAEGLMAEARKFEAANAGKNAEILSKYREVLAAAAGHAKVYNEAQTKVLAFEKLTAGGVVKNSGAPSGALKEALDQAEKLKTVLDFDGARKVLRDFMTASLNLEESNDARKELAKLDESALAKIAEYTEKTKTLDPLAQALEWGKYTSTVKDALNASKVAPILEALEDKTQDAAMEDLKKGGDKVKDGKYAEGISAMAEMQKKWAGMKWAVMAKSKENSYRAQKELLEKFYALLKEKTAAGPLALPFPVQTKIKNQTKWAVVGVQNESIVLDPIPPKAAPGVNTRLWELQPLDQYNLVLFAMPKEPSPEQHKQLQLFCIERGLMDQADKHEKKAGG